VNEQVHQKHEFATQNKLSGRVWKSERRSYKWLGCIWREAYLLHYHISELNTMQLCYENSLLSRVLSLWKRVLYYRNKWSNFGPCQIAVLVGSCPVGDLNPSQKYRCWAVSCKLLLSSSANELSLKIVHFLHNAGSIFIGQLVPYCSQLLYVIHWFLKTYICSQATTPASNMNSFQNFHLWRSYWCWYEHQQQHKTFSTWPLKLQFVEGNKFAVSVNELLSFEQ